MGLIGQQERIIRTDFFKGKQCARVNQRRFGGKRGSRSQSTTTYGFQREYRGGGNKFSNVRSFIFLQLGDGLSPFNKNNRVNISGEKKVK